MNKQNRSNGKGTGKSFTEENTNQATQTPSQDKRKSFEQVSESNDPENRSKSPEPRKPGSAQEQVKKEDEPVEEKSDTIQEQGG